MVVTPRFSIVAALVGTPGAEIFADTQEQAQGKVDKIIEPIRRK